jgi:hypothetical protein
VQQRVTQGQRQQGGHQSKVHLVSLWFWRNGAGVA